MKLTKFSNLICIILFIVSVFAAATGFAQWSTDIRHTNNAGFSFTSGNNAKNIEFSGTSNVHTVWYDARFGDTEIMYKRSTDNGATWEAVVRLTNNAGASELPSIAASGSNIHVVWQDQRDGNFEIYYKLSTNHGVTWSGDERLTTNGATSVNPSISLRLNVIQVVWQDDRDGNNEIYFKRSLDNGITWEPIVRMTNNSGSSTSPSITTDSGENTHIVWQDNRDGNDEIYYINSTNSGLTWAAESRFTTNSAASKKPCIQRFYTSGVGSLNVVWEDDRDGNFEIYLKRSTNNGSTWEAIQRITNSTGNSYAPALSVSPTHIHLVWEDNRTGTYGIYYNVSSNSGVSWASDLKLNTGTAVARYPLAGFSVNKVYVLWSDLRDSDYEIYYKQNPTGNPTGITNINSQTPDRFSLSQNYPNPFNPVTNIEFSVPHSGLVNITVYDALGREIETLVSDELNPGTYNAAWDASGYNSGVYFYRFTSGSFTETKKMILVK